MARMHEFEPIYRACPDFERQCFLANRSFLWGELNAWTPSVLDELKQRLIDAPIFGAKLSFEEKLVQQMAGASRQHWAVLGDVYYLYFLPSSYIKPDRKRRSIMWVAEQGGLSEIPQDTGIWSAQSVGFVRTTLKYHSKYAQFWLILLTARQLKSNPAPERLLSEPVLLQQMLDQILTGIPNRTDRAYDMRHALLYMAFPETYEPAISTQDKQWIVERYKDRVGEHLPQDIDQALLAIRRSLSKEHDKPDRPFDFYDDLQAEWRPKRTEGGGSGGSNDKVKQDTQTRDTETVKKPEPDLSADRDLQNALTALAHTRNVVLHGPPGTGKTFIARKAAEALVKSQIQTALTASARAQRLIEGLTFYDVLALSMYVTGAKRSYTVPELGNQPLLQARLQALPVAYPQQNIWGNLQSHTSPDSQTVKVSKRSEPYLFDKDKNSRWVLTEAGSEYVESNLKDQITAMKASTGTGATLNDFVFFVTFHQSYAYEDFVEGLRPVASEDDPSAVYVRIVPGIFQRLCIKAAADSANKYVLVIDEINRGNISKIFGELIALLEDDKRSGETGALTSSLAYSGLLFSVPNNLYVIGTMNTADRSIALLDVALRRRFAFVELMPRPELLGDASVTSGTASVSLQQLLEKLNAALRRHVDRDHQIGHSYLLRLAHASERERLELLEFVWNNQLLPLLEEYFYSRRDRLAEVLASFRSELDAGEGTELALTMNSEFGRLSGEDLVFALSQLADSG